MFGCDYCSNIPRIGNKTAFNLIKKHKNIETILPLLKHVPDGYVQKYHRSRDLFSIYYDKLDMNQINIHHSYRNLDTLTNYLINDCNISESRVQNTIKKIMQGYK